MQIENKRKILFYLLWRIKEIVEILSRTTSLFLALQQTHRLLLFNKKPGIALPGIFYGGADEDRTRDLLVANETLSQLSYSPRTRIDSIKKKEVIQFKINTQESQNRL